MADQNRLTNLVVVNTLKMTNKFVKTFDSQVNVEGIADEGTYIHHHHWSLGLCILERTAVKRLSLNTVKMIININIC